MTRFLVTLVAVAMFQVDAKAGDLIAEDEMVGRWKIEPSTFTVRELAFPNSFPRPQLPANHTGFTFILKGDRSFLATNVPARVLFDRPATAAIKGKWSVRTNLPAFGPTNSAEGYSVFTFWSEGPSNTITISGGPVYWFGKSPRRPAIMLGPRRDETRTYEWCVLITKQE